MELELKEKKENPKLNSDKKMDKVESPLRKLISRFLERRIAIVGLGIIAIVILCAIFASLLAPYSAIEQNLINRIMGPSAQHILGTDSYGRDVLSRILYGARISIMVAVVATSIGMVVGGLLGTISAYYGRFVDNIIMRIMDILLAFPTILLALLIMAALGPSTINIIIAIGITSIPEFARIARGSVLSIKESDYILAEHAMGASDKRVILKHIIPNILAPVIILLSLQMGTAIITEASLSFLGLGVDPSVPSWGSVIADGRALLRDAPWVSISGGIAVMVTVIGFNFIGDGLRDALDPKASNER